MSSLTFGADGMLEEMSHEQEIVGAAIGYWDIAKPVVLALNLKPEHCAEPWHRLALECAFDIDLRDGAVNLESVVDELFARGVADNFRAVGEAFPYLLAITSSVIVPTRSNVLYHTTHVMESARCRRLGVLAARLNAAAMTGTDVREIVGEINAAVRR